LEPFAQGDGTSRSDPADHASKPDAGLGPLISRAVKRVRVQVARGLLVSSLEFVCAERSVRSVAMPRPSRTSPRTLFMLD